MQVREEGRRAPAERVLGTRSCIQLVAGFLPPRGVVFKGLKFRKSLQSTDGMNTK